MALTAVQTIESTIPEGMTINEWRRARTRPSTARRTRGIAALLTTAACVLAGGSSTALAAPEPVAVTASKPAKISPSVGSARTAFRVSLRAPYRADGYETMYIFEAYGPPGCAASVALSRSARKGQRLVMRLRTSDVHMPTEGVSAWCRGRYIGNLWFQTAGDEPNKFLANVQFRVR